MYIILTHALKVFHNTKKHCIETKANADSFELPLTKEGRTQHVHVCRVGRYQQYVPSSVYLDNQYLGMTKIILLTKCRVS